MAEDGFAALMQEGDGKFSTAAEFRQRYITMVLKSLGG